MFPLNSSVPKLGRLAASCLIFNLLAKPSDAQSSVYDQKITLGDSLLTADNYLAAGNAYSAAFESNGWRGSVGDRKKAARAWAMAGVADSAFFNLFRMAEKQNFDRLDDLKADKWLASLRSDARWPRLCEAIRANQPKMPGLADTLAKVLADDQRYRGVGDPKLGRVQMALDSANQRIVVPILEKLGWLGPKDVGDDGAQAIFLVIQHADSPLQEKYLPMLRAAVREGRARASSLALLEDRVLVRQHKRQLYGSQLRNHPATGQLVFYPIEDVENVDKRRAEMSLEPLADYARRFGKTWDAAEAEKNKAMLPDF